MIVFAGVSREEVEYISKNFNFSPRLLELREGDAWHEGLRAIHTPGHNKSHHSIVIDFNNRQLVVAGDAIVSKCYYDADKVYPYNGDFMSEEIALKSMGKIKLLADIIIPGHAQPFQNWKIVDEKEI
jgi:glyoxylase-like metal-dependent hydrolase (beta-lactamase superfamily II)